MRIVVGCDHAGFPLKQIIIQAVQAAGHEVVDVGTNTPAPIDYPDITLAVGRAILEGRAERGIMLCGSGIGACITANKIHGIYASVCHDTYSAHQGVEHDTMNVLCLGARIIGPEIASELVHSFVQASFQPEERHVRRVGKMHKVEAEGR
jgi:RpiB/LacA/LacB family sugar-phosphate isomerase